MANDSPQSKNTGGKKVLVVEDDTFLAEMLGRKLTQRGLELEHTTRAEEAEELVKENNFNLICLDILLPGKDGITFLQELRARDDQKANTPVLIISNYGDDEKVNAAQEAGIEDYLVKANVSPDAIVDEVAEILESQ